MTPDPALRRRREKGDPRATKRTLRQWVTLARVVEFVLFGTLLLGAFLVLRTRTDENNGNREAVSADSVHTEVRAGRQIDPGTLVSAAGSQASDADAGRQGVEMFASIKGRVLYDGRPIAGAVVRLNSSLRTVSRADGSYWFQRLPPQDLFLDATLDALMASNRSVRLALAPGEVRIVDLELDCSSSISGQVVDQRGNPLSGVHVSWSCAPCLHGERSTTRADGTFLTSRLRAGGTYVGVVHTDSGADYPMLGAPESARVAILDHPVHVTGVRLVVDSTLEAIAGRVLEEDGTPAANEVVVAEYVNNDGRRVAREVTDNQGSYRLELPRGVYSVGVGEQSEWARREGVPTGRNDVDIVLPAPGSVHGTLLGFPETERGTYVTTQTASGRGFSWYALGHDADFTVPRVPPGERWFWANGGGRFAYARVVVASGDVTEIALRPLPTATLSVRLFAERLVRHECVWLAHVPGMGLATVGRDIAERPMGEDAPAFETDAPAGLQLRFECIGRTADGGVVQGTTTLNALVEGGRATCDVELKRIGR